MKNKLIYILFISFLFTQDEIGTGLNTQDLINYLKSNYTTSSTLSYNSARDVMYGEIYNINGQVSCFYTNFTVQNVPTSNPRPVVHAGGLNCEHLWPQSLGAGSGNPKNDMHHLKPCKENVNSYRSNNPFSEIVDSQTDNWLWLNYNLSNIPNNNIEEFSESTNSLFEPREDVKGDVARSIFYFYTIYNNVADDNFFNQQKNTLYQWHLSDPADNSEIERTWLIAEYQNNIPNPFIIDSTLVYRCYFYNESDLGCDGMPNSGLLNDDCGVCGGDNSSCIDSCGIPNGNNTTCADLNNDNTINVTDVVLLVNLILTQSSNTLGDVNNDNNVNVTDVVMLINIILGDSE
tara:strand:+ start:642 stop:1682 length:1041 start_codon:yes stop_codon:yes gene_type:complete